MQSSHLILLIDSRADDLLLMVRAFRTVGIQNPIRAIHDLEEGRCYLRGDGCYANRQHYPLPSIVVLDLMSPLGCAFGLLRETRQLPGLENIPIIVFAPHERARVVQEAYDLGANAVFTKGIELNSLATSIRDLEFLGDLLHAKTGDSREASVA